MGGYASTRSKLFCVPYDEIQDRINAGEIDLYDVVYTTDTHENIIIIPPDYSLVSVRSKIYRFPDISTAEDSLNKSTDTYAGQIVAIAHRGKYVGYIVNSNNAGKFYVSTLNSAEGEVNYNSLGDRPITNLEGTVGKSVIINKLSTGIYRIKGQYKISSEAETVYMSPVSNLFLVEQDDSGITHIKKISAGEIVDFTVDDKSNISSSVVPTTEWLESQGYVTESAVDQKIAALDFITKSEVESYVYDLVINMIDGILDERIEMMIDEKISPINSEDIHGMF